MTAQIDVPQPGFDPARWLAAFTDLGGGYALMADRRLALIMNGPDGDTLDSVMSQIVGNADRQEAVKSAIERLQAGEVRS